MCNPGILNTRGIKHSGHIFVGHSEVCYFSHRFDSLLMFAAIRSCPRGKTSTYLIIHRRFKETGSLVKRSYRKQQTRQDQNAVYGSIYQAFCAITGRPAQRVQWLVDHPMHWIDLVISFFSVCLFVNTSVFERLRPQFFTRFHHILHAAQKCGRFDAYRLRDKAEVVCQF